MPCAICLESKHWYQEIRKLKCNHKFHLRCIQNWSSINKTCPICRIQILPQKPVNFLIIKGIDNISVETLLHSAGIESGTQLNCDSDDNSE